jgi:hypothetical protein
MMSHFKTRLVLEVVDEGWQLTQPFIYHSELLNRDIEVPAGYVTDLASVPRLFRFIVPVANAKNRRAAVVHDYLCTNPEGLVKDQKQADQVFREALGVVGVGRFRSAALYYPVRTFQSIKGWFS